MTEVLLQSQELDSKNNFDVLLKPVFDACDYNGDGYVKIQDLIELGQEYSVGSGEELEIILQQLDANGEGRITFHEFTKRVQEIITAPKDNNNELIDLSPVNEEHPLMVVSDADHVLDEERPRSHTDSEGFFEEIDSTSYSTTSTTDAYAEFEDVNNSPQKYMNNLHTPPKNFFTKMKQDTSIYSTYPPNGKRPRKNRSSLLAFQQKQLSQTTENQSLEEGFEAFGECNGSISSEPVKWQMHMSPSDSSLFRLSGNRVARNLRQVQSARTSLHGSMEDLRLHDTNHIHSLSDNEGDYMALSEEIRKLSSQLTIMKMDQDDHDDKQRRIREDNRMLVNRINALEEQLIDQKTSSLKVVENETQKYRKELQKLQRDNSEHIDKLQMKLHEAELEIANLKTVEPMLRKEIESALEERREAQKKIEELQNQLIEKEKEIEQLKYKLRSKIDELEREKSQRSHEVQALSEEVDNLRYMKDAALNQFDERKDLIKQIDLLKKENETLKSTKDDLRNQLVTQHTTFEMNKEHTLADELAHANKDDVLDALRAEENENHRLRQYIDQLLSLIVQSNPLLLEK